MATLKTIHGKRGDSYKVEWREGGARDGDWSTETFNPQKDPARDLDAAEDFRKAVVAAGHHWPDFYAPGYGYLSPAEFLTRQRALDASASADGSAPTAPVLTLDEFAPDHIDSLTDVEGATKGRYQQIFRDRIRPFFGACDMRDDDAPSTRDARKWINALLEGERNPDYDPDAENPDECPEWLREPCSAKTARNTHGVASLLFKAAVEEKLRRFNPFHGIKLPSPEDDGEGDEEMCYLSPEDFALLLDAMALDARPLTEFLAGTGLRFSEATALKVKDLHLDGPTPHLRVWRAWKQGAGRGHLGAPKTRAGKRRIALTSDQVELLRRAIAGRERDGGAFVFSGPTGGAWSHSTYYSQRWQHALYRAVRCSACRAADYDAGIGRRGYRDLTLEHIIPCGHEGTTQKVPRVHDLRHTHVAWLIALNVPLLAISRRLGHKSIQITADRYGHLLPEVEDEMVAGLGGLMSRVHDARFRLAA